VNVKVNMEDLKFLLNFSPCLTNSVASSHTRRPYYLVS